MIHFCILEKTAVHNLTRLQQQEPTHSYHSCGILHPQNSIWSNLHTFPSASGSNWASIFLLHQRHISAFHPNVCSVVFIIWSWAQLWNGLPRRWCWLSGPMSERPINTPVLLKPCSTQWLVRPSRRSAESSGEKVIHFCLCVYLQVVGMDAD